jgi:hypothetical protein
MTMEVLYAVYAGKIWMKSNIAGSERGTLEAAVSILFQAYQTTNIKS